jgi:hypothetical protein
VLSIAAYNSDRMRSAIPIESSASERRRLPVALAVLGCVLTIAACGSSSHSTTSVAAGHSAFLAFAECLRSHGVPDFPDPSAAGGIQIQAGSGINPFSPAFKGAQSDCRHLLPVGGPPTEPTAQDKQAMLATSECMRAHGVSGFPDPTTTPPSSSNGYSQVIGRDGVFIAVPDTIDVASPAYRNAAAVCRFG